MTDSTYTVNFQRIANDTESSSLVRRTASQIMLNGGYMNLGEWLKSLSTIELLDLCNMAETVFEAQEEAQPGEPAFQAIAEFVILGTMLTAAEGSVDLTDEVIDKHSKAIMFLCVTEGLYRKGLIELYHDKIDFTSNEKIAKLKDTDD